MNASTKNYRNNHIDYLKGITIILVVFGHCWLTSHELRWLIYRFHMPLFFCISRYLFKNIDNYYTFVTKKFKTLLIPYIIFFILSYIISKLFLNNILSIQHMIIYLYLNGKYCTQVNNWALWYLPLFFVSNNCFYFITKIKKQKILFYILLILFFITVPVNLFLQKITLDSYIPFTLQTLIPSLFFMLIGYLYKINLNKIKNKLNKNTLLKSFSLLIIGIFISIKNSDQIIDIRTYQYIITALLIIQFIITYTKNKTNKLICYLGKNTLIILGFHRIILFLFEYYFKPILIKINLHLGSIIITTLCISIICILKEIVIKSKKLLLSFCQKV